MQRDEQPDVGRTPTPAEPPRPRFAHVVWIGYGPLSQRRPDDPEPQLDWEEHGPLRRRGAELQLDDDTIDELVVFEYDVASLQRMGFDVVRASRLWWRLHRASGGSPWMWISELSRTIGEVAISPAPERYLPWCSRFERQRRAGAWDVHRCLRRERRPRRRAAARRARGMRSGTDPGQDDDCPPGWRSGRLARATAA